MCRFAFSANGLVFYRPLACSTSADELYHEAKRQTENLNARLIAVEPCAEAFSTAIEKPPGWGPALIRRVR